MSRYQEDYRGHRIVLRRAAGRTWRGTITGPLTAELHVAYPSGGDGQAAKIRARQDVDLFIELDARDREEQE